MYALYETIHIHADWKIVMMLNPVCLALILFYALPQEKWMHNVKLSLHAAMLVSSLLLLFMFCGKFLLQQFAINFNVFALFGSVFLVLACLKSLLFDARSTEDNFDLIAPFAFPIAAGPLILSKMMQLDGLHYRLAEHMLSSVLNTGLIMCVIALVFILVSCIMKIPKIDCAMPLVIKLSYVFYACLGVQSIISAAAHLA